MVTTKDERVLKCEQTVLGQMILDNSVIPLVYDVVKPACFENKVNADIFTAIYKLYSSGVHVDYVCLVNELPKVDVMYISTLADDVASAANWRFYAEKIKDAYMLRSINRISAETQEEIKNGLMSNVSAQEIYNNMESKLAELTTNTSSCQVTGFKELVEMEAGQIQRYIENKKQWLGYDTGFEQINDIIGGLQSVFMIIGARPSMGKTALAQQIAWSLSKQAKVLFVELEMSGRQVSERFVSHLTRIPFGKIRSGLLTENMVHRIIGQMQNMAENENFVLGECRNRRLSDIVNLCRQQVRNNGVKIIFIDHIGLIHSDVKGQSWENARAVIDALQQLRLELDVPIIALSQLSRDNEGKKDPDLASFRGSGAAEEDADICCFINRDRAHEVHDTDIPTEFVVAKNRDGAVGAAHLIFKPEIVTFEEDKDGELAKASTPVAFPKKEETKVEAPKEPPKPVEPPKQEDLWPDDDSGEKYDIF